MRALRQQPRLPGPPAPRVPIPVFAPARSGRRSGLTRGPIPQECDSPSGETDVPALDNHIQPRTGVWGPAPLSSHRETSAPTKAAANKSLPANIRDSGAPGLRARRRAAFTSAG